MNEHATFSTEVGVAIKLADLPGALLNHKNDKKGHHDNFRDYAREKLKCTFTFPDWDISCQGMRCVNI